MSNTQKPTPIGRVMLNDVRLSFPGLFKPSAFKPGDEAKYKATFLIPKDSPQLAEVKAKIVAVVRDKYPQKFEQILKGIANNPNKFCLQDGDTKSYDGYEGMMALSAKNKARPMVIDEMRQPLTESDGKPYAGCYVNASVEFFVYDSQGVGVSASLRAVQFLRHGDAFSGSAPADVDEFSEVAGENSGAAADLF